MTAPDAERQAGRLRIRSRRGMKELVELLERYLDARLAEASAAERAELAALLELQDPVLAGHLLHGVPATDPALARAVARILATPAAQRA
jgi:succinate dehydrogenase flavin-adding protein (antitoxin of CptAB toxin-antitoxin module)